MDATICARIPYAVVADIDILIKHKMYMNRSDAVRDFARRGVREELAKIKEGAI